MFQINRRCETLCFKPNGSLKQNVPNALCLHRIVFWKTTQTARLCRNRDNFFFQEHEWPRMIHKFLLSVIRVVLVVLVVFNTTTFCFLEDNTNNRDNFFSRTRMTTNDSLIFIVSHSSCPSCSSCLQYKYILFLEDNTKNMDNFFFQEHEWPWIIHLSFAFA